MGGASCDVVESAGEFVDASDVAGHAVELCADVVELGGASCDVVESAGEFVDASDVAGHAVESGAELIDLRCVGAGVET